MVLKSVLAACLAVFFLMVTGNIAAAQEVPVKWMQQAAISPDGKWIAFEYHGNVFKVPSAGGTAVQLTKGSFYSGYPVWSHNSKMLAFAADEHGNFDVYLMTSAGENIRRLTYNSSRDIPYDFSVDNKQVMFGTDRHDVYTSARFPGDYIFNKLYTVPATGGKSILVNSAGMDYAHLNKNGEPIDFVSTRNNHHIAIFQGC